MNELAIQNENLPVKMEDLSRFVLVGREKYNSVRAEVRAIEKVNLAREVINQKKQEAQMLSEVLLDAEVRLGELFKDIPTASKGNQYTGKMVCNTDVTNQKSKEETINELGFNRMQASRLETLANNADLVEYVKAEARENGEFPTRTRVLELAANRNKNDNSGEARIINMTDYQQKQDENSDEYDEYEDFLDLRNKVYKDFMKIVDLIARFEITPQKMDAFRDNFDDVLKVEDHAGYVNEAIDKLNLIKTEIWCAKTKNKNYTKIKYNINIKTQKLDIIKRKSSVNNKKYT